MHDGILKVKEVKLHSNYAAKFCEAFGDLSSLNLFHWITMIFYRIYHKKHIILLETDARGILVPNEPL